MNDKTIICLCSGGRYFVHLVSKDGYSIISNPERYRINSLPLIQTSKEKWYECEEEPKDLSVMRDDTFKTVGYHLKHQFECDPTFASLPNMVPFEYFKLDPDHDVRLHGEVYHMYEPVQEIDVPAHLRDCGYTFQIHKVDYEPFTPKYKVQYSFIESLKHVEELHPTLPCTIKPSDLFHVLLDAVESYCKDKTWLSLKEYRNIESFSVDLKIEVNFSLIGSFWNPWAKRKKDRTYTQEIHFKTERVMEYDLRNGRYPPKLEAANYWELERKIDEFVKEEIETLDTGRFEMCPHCKGQAYIKKEKK